MFLRTVHSERFLAAVLYGDPHTPDGCLSVAASQGGTATPAGAWTPALGREWRCLPRESPPARPQDRPGHFGLPIAAGSSCTLPEGEGHRDAEEGSLWGGVGASRPFLPSEPAVKKDETFNKNVNWGKKSKYSIQFVSQIKPFRI